MGLMTKHNLKKQMKFCRKVRKLKVGQELWDHHISFYVDGKGFEFKTNSLDQEKEERGTKTWVYCYQN